MRRSNLILVPLAAATLGGLTLIAACGDDSGGSKPTQVSVVLSEFKIEMPSTIAAGPTRWTAKNTGQQDHQVTIGRIKDGKTADDVLAALALPEGGEAAALALIDLYGTPQGVAPGKEQSTLVDLPAGNYLALCFVPDPADGVPHLAKGMVTKFEVTGTGKGTAIPKSDNVIKLSEFKFDIPASIDWKKPVVVQNIGTQPHEIAINRIADGKTIDDVKAFLASPTPPAGPPPFGESSGGITGMAPGTSAVMELKLTPGKYVFLCFFPDPASGAPHFVQGMVQEVTVG